MSNGKREAEIQGNSDDNSANKPKRRKINRVSTQVKEPFQPNSTTSKTPIEVNIGCIL